MAAKRKKKNPANPRRRRRRHNPGNPGNPRRRRRRRHNPGGSGTLAAIAFTVVGGVAAAVLNWGVRQTSLTPRNAALVSGGAALVAGGALGYFVSPAVGGGLAATGGVLGTMQFLDSAPGGTKASGGGSQLRGRAIKRLAVRNVLNGLDDDGDDLEALGLLSAELTGLDDDDNLDDDDDEGLGAIEAQLEGGLDDGDDDDGDDDDDLGAIEAQLEGGLDDGDDDDLYLQG